MLVGGMTFVFFALRPALSRQAEQAAVKSVSAFVRTRFRLIGILLTTLIVASGIVNIILSPPEGWLCILALIFKVFLGAGVLALYFRNAFAKAPTFVAPEPSAPEPRSAEETSPAEKASEWKTAWLLAPTRSQVNMELMLIGGASVVILLGIVLVLAS